MSLRAQLKQLRQKFVLKVHGSGSKVQGMSAAELELAPINPAWIEEGAPEARGCCAIRSDDGRLLAGEWSCTAGRFAYTYYEDEVIRILEGETFIEIDGAYRRFGPGDVIFFPLGVTVRWHVPSYVRKAFFISRPGRVVEFLRTFSVPGLRGPPAQPSVLTP